MIAKIISGGQTGADRAALDFGIAHGIPTFIDARHTIAHNKIMIVDGREVLTGSFNFTKAEEEDNSENLLVIQDPGLAAKYTENWRVHLERSERYTGAKVLSTRRR